MAEPTKSSEPRADAPWMFGSRADSTPLPWTWATERLTTAPNYWISTTRLDGRPHARPVWGVWLDGACYFSTGSLAAAHLPQHPDITVHLESGSEVVIIEGRAPRRRSCTHCSHRRRVQPEVSLGHGSRRAAGTVLRGEAERRVRLDLRRHRARPRRRIRRVGDPLEVLKTGVRPGTTGRAVRETHARCSHFRTRGSGRTIA